MTRRFAIEEAVRRGQKARVALAAPAGAGKTWTALTIAAELVDEGDKVLVIDTERGSASLYADQFKFSTIRWDPPYSPAELAQVLKDVTAQFGVVIVDSLSHFWMGEGGTLDIVDDAGARASGNRFAGWKTGTPVQAEMVDAMLVAPCHVIATMRSKMDYVQEKDERGKTTIKRVGMNPIQRDGIEYEFTVTADLDIEHRLTVAKTRCSALADKSYKPGHAAEMGATLRQWLADADPEEAPALVPQYPAVSSADFAHRFAEKCAANGVAESDAMAMVQQATNGRSANPAHCTDPEREALRLIFKVALTSSTAGDEGSGRPFEEATA